MEALKSDYPLAAEWLAEMYRTGKFVEKDKNKAEDIFQKYKTSLIDLCVCGDKYAQYMYGFDRLYGTFINKDIQEGILWMQKATDSGLTAAQVEIAKCFLYGKAYEQNIEKAMEMLQEICDKSKNKKAHYELAKIYYIGKYVKEDNEKAFRLFMIAAEQGHVLSQGYIGDMYYWGQGVEKNNVEARKWYELAAEYNDKSSLKQLGYIYYNGYGVEEDEDKAFEYFKAAADLGDARSQYMLHWFYFGDGKYKDYKLGKEYIEKAAEAGDILAQKKLARLYISDFGFDDDNKFFEWMMKAAEKNDAEAERIIAEAYIYHYGTEKNIDEALNWFERAIEHGDGQAAYKLAEMYILGNDIQSNVQKGIQLLSKAEELIRNNKNSTADNYCYIADLYVKFSDKDMLQKAMDNYCYAYILEKDDIVLVNIALLHFIHELDIDDIDEDDASIVKKLKNIAEKSESYLPASILGDIYYHGYRKIEKDEEEGIKWYQIAYEKGSLGAGCKVAFYYMTKTNNSVKGMEMFFEIDKKNYPEAAYWIGLCYKKGTCVKQDKSKAKAYLKKAADLGDESAKEELKKFIF